MVNIRKQIYDVLNAIPDVQVYQERPEVIATFPSITYKVTENVPKRDLGKLYIKQDVEIIIDIWTKTSKEGDTLFALVESGMLALDYLCTFNSDIVDPSGISHLTTRFKF